MKARLYTWIFGAAYLFCAVMFFVIIAGFQSALSDLALPLPYFTKVVFAIRPIGWLLLTVAVGSSAVIADLRFRSRLLGSVFVIVLAVMGCCIAVGVILPLISMHQMAGNAQPNKTLQAIPTHGIGTARTDLDGEGDRLLPGFVAASPSAPVPELGR